MSDLTKYTGHTPGDWRCIDLTSDVGIYDDSGTRIGRMNRRADAILAISAPALLAEVKRLRADLAEAVAAVRRLMDGTSDLQDAMDACNQARAVLAKHTDNNSGC